MYLTGMLLMFSCLEQSHLVSTVLLFGESLMSQSQYSGLLIIFTEQSSLQQGQHVGEF